MSNEFLRGFRLGVGCEVGRGRDCSHPQIGANSHGDHVLFHLLAQADARVVAVCDDVDQAEIHNGLNMDFRIVEQELCERRHQDGLGGVVRSRNADRAGGFVT